MSFKALKAEVVLPIILLIVLFSVGWTQTQKADRWEYGHTQVSSAQMQEAIGRLNQFGAQNYELVAVEREQDNGRIHFYFKRRL